MYTQRACIYEMLISSNPWIVYVPCVALYVQQLVPTNIHAATVASATGGPTLAVVTSGVQPEFLNPVHRYRVTDHHDELSESSLVADQPRHIARRHTRARVSNTCSLFGASSV